MMDNRKALPSVNSTQITLYDLNTTKPMQFIIQNEKGRGGSGIVYNALVCSGKDGEWKRAVLLKEFYPCDYQSCLRRREDAALRIADAIPKSMRDAYHNERKSFLDMCRKQIDFFNNKAPESADELVDVQGIYQYGDSVYCVMSAASGDSWDQVALHKETLHDILETLLSVLNELELYHQNNILHCDIKPANIYLFKKTRQHVRLLDFGSTQQLINGHLTGNEWLSYSNDYAAPEILKAVASDEEREIFYEDIFLNITPKADLYSAAAILYEKLTGLRRDPYMRDSEFRTVLNESLEQLWEKEKNVWLKNIRRAIIQELKVFLQKGLTKYPRKRYTLPEMRAALKSLLIMAAPQKIHLAPECKAPAPTSEFTGRKSELKTLEDILHSENHTIFIYGDGGLGKSELTLKLAEKLRDSFDFYRITFAGDLEETLLSIPVEPLMLDKNPQGEESLRQNKEEQYQRILHCLQSYGSTSVLIIDNFDLPPKHENEVFHSRAYRDFMGLNMKILFTSRSRPKLDAICLEVDCLSESDLLALIRAYYKDEGNGDTFREIIRLSEYNTLIVELAAKTLEQSWGRLSPENLRQLFRECEGTIYNRIRQLFDVTLLRHDYRKLMAQTAVFPTGGIDAGICLMCHSDSEQDKIRLLELNGWLRKTTGNLLVVHPLVQEVCRKELPQKEEACREFLMRYEKLYATTAVPDDVRARTRWQVADVFSNAADHLYDSDGSYANKAGEYNYRADRLRSALLYFQRAYENYKIQPNVDPDKAMDLLISVAFTCQALGFYEDAIYYMTQGIIVYKQMEGENSAKSSRYYSCLATLYKEQGNYPYALDAYQKAEQLHNGQDRLGLGQLYVNLCQLYNRIGNDAEAKRYGQMALHCIDSLPSKKLSVKVLCASLYITLGIIAENTEDFQKSLDYYDYAITIYKEAYGEDSRHLIAVYLNKGIILSRMGRYNEALTHLEKCEKKIREIILDGEHPSLANCWHNMAEIYCRKENYAEALVLCRKAMKVREQFYGTDNPLTAPSYIQYATILYFMKEPLEKAMDYCFRAYKIYWKASAVQERSFSKELNQTMNNIYRAYLESGRNPNEFVNWLKRTYGAP